MLCARECPDWCIYIDSHKETLPAPEGGRPRARNVLDRFAIDFSLCMYCGICIEVCPFDALFWSPEFEYAEGDIRNLVHEKDRLAAWVQTVPPPPAHEPNADPPKELTAATRPTPTRPTGPAADPARPTPGSGRPAAGSARTPGRASGAGPSGAPAQPESGTAPGRASASEGTRAGGEEGQPGGGATPPAQAPGTGSPEASAQPEPGPGAPASGRTSGAGLSGTPARPEPGPAPSRASASERARAGGEEEQPGGGATPSGTASEAGPGHGGADVAGTDPAEGSARPPAGRTPASRPERPVRRASASHASVRAIRPPGSLPKPGSPSDKNDLSTGRSDPKKLSTDESGVPPAGGTPEQTSATDPDGEPEEES
ncbi:4Fe-4S binding protein [Planobispora siamensis]|nr:4Fe-4S binding protein [Planobispora siamensis]